MSNAAEEIYLIRAVLEGYAPSVPRGDALRACRALEAALGQGEAVGSEYVVSGSMEDAEAASDGMLPTPLVPVADEWYRLCERRFSAHRINISGELAEAIVNAVCAKTPAPQSEPTGRTLYVDLDGVMADFDGAFPALFGLDHRSLADDEMWEHINSHASFFRDLPPMPGAIEFFRSVEHLQPVILTACPKSNYAHVAAQKRAWVRAHLSQTCLVLPVMGGRHKPLFMHQAGDVLIDDFGKNCVAWNEAGGIAIKHEGDWSATRAALDLISNGGAPNA